MKEFHAVHFWRFEPTTPLDFGEYRVVIKKNGELVRCIQYAGMSGTAMMDVRYDLKRQYPKEKGYTVE